MDAWALYRKIVEGIKKGLSFDEALDEAWCALNGRPFMWAEQKEKGLR